MFTDPPIAFREFAMSENLPLATIHAAVLEFLRGRVDAAIFGAQAVNAYVDTPDSDESRQHGGPSKDTQGTNGRS